VIAAVPLRVLDFQRIPSGALRCGPGDGQKIRFGLSCQQSAVVFVIQCNLAVATGGLIGRFLVASSDYNDGNPSIID